MKAVRAANMTELHEGLCDYVVKAPKEKLDMVTTVDVQLHDVVAQADSMRWDFDLKDMWLTKSRWSMMVRQYLDPTELVTWINRSAQMVNWTGRGLSTLRTKLVLPRGGKEFGNKETRRWGSCMLAVTYRAVPHPQITLVSRTSYLGYLGALDMSVAWMCGRYLAEVMGHDVEEMRFVWMNQAMQYHHFKSLAFLLNHHDPVRKAEYRRLLMAREPDLLPEDKDLIASAPALMYSRKWVQKTLDEDERGDTLGDISYNTYRRIKRRFHTEVLGFEHAQKFEGWSYYKKGPKVGEKRDYYKAYEPLPHTPIDSLDFTPLGLPSIDRLGLVDYDAADAAIDEEDEDDD